MTMKKARNRLISCSRMSARLMRSFKTLRKGEGTIRELTWKSCKVKVVANIWIPMISSKCSSAQVVVPSEEVEVVILISTISEVVVDEASDNKCV
jgi:hypothetical protein